MEPLSCSVIEVPQCYMQTHVYSMIYRMILPTVRLQFKKQSLFQMIGVSAVFIKNILILSALSVSILKRVKAAFIYLLSLFFLLHRSHPLVDIFLSLCGYALDILVSVFVLIFLQMTDSLQTLRWSSSSQTVQKNSKVFSSFCLLLHIFVY